MDALRAAIAARKSASKRPEITQSESKSADNQLNQPPNKRFKTNREIQAEKTEAEKTDKASKSVNLSTTATDETKHSEELNEASKNESVNDETSQSATDTQSKDVSASQSLDQSTNQSINHFEVKKRLRTLGVPIQLFGESPTDRLNRLKNQSVDASSRAELHGQNRSFIQSILTREVEREISQNIYAQMEKQREQSSNPTSNQSNQSNLSKKALKYSTLPMNRSAYDNDSDFVLAFLRRVLSEWEIELMHRSIEVSRSVAGKMQSANQKQTREYVKPLIDILKARVCDTEMLNDIHGVCLAAVRGQYQAAQQQYLKLAIGNAPWPMGVTMVSIHERSGRQRIQGDQVAHVLNDDTQRKYISSIKRLVTWAQEHHPQGFDDAIAEYEQTK